MRTWMKIGVGLAVVVVVAAVGVLIAVQSINLDRVKEVLTEQVQTATGRTLTIDGPLALKIGLTPSVAATNITLSNPPGATRAEMIKIGRFEMEIALQPLLQRKVAINRLLLFAPDILIETEANGPGNLDFTRGGEQQKPQPAATERGGAPFAFTLNEVKIENGVIAWHDRTAKKTETVTLQTLSLQPHQNDATLVALRMRVQARGHAMELGGTMGTVADALTGKPWPINLKGTVDGISVQAEGSVAELAAFRGVQLKIASEGGELIEVARLAGVNRPDLPQSAGPFKVSARLHDSGGQLHLADLVLEAGKRDLALFNAKGSVNDLAGKMSIDLAVNGESANPAALIRLAGSDASFKGPLQFAGHLRGSGATWQMGGLTASIGGSDLAGELAIHTGTRPQVSGKLSATTFDLADFIPPAASENKPVAAKSGSGDGRLFADTPLPVGPLRSVDLDLTLHAGTLISAERRLTDVAVSVLLKDGRMTIKPFRFGLAEGIFEGLATLDAAGKTPAVALRLNGRQFELGQFDQGGHFSGGRSNLNIDLKGSGATVRALMASLTGETVLDVGQGRLRNKAMDWAAGDLLFQVLGAINPFAKSEDTTQMTCAAVRFLVRDGIATTDKGLALRTASVDVVGSGTVDLRSEQLDLGIKPRARGGVGLSLSSPLAGLVRVNGTLAQPSVGIDAAGTLKTAASVGAGVATGGLSVLGELLIDKVSADEDPCRTALGHQQPNQDQPAAAPQKQGSRNLLQGVFGR